MKRLSNTFINPEFTRNDSCYTGGTKHVQPQSVRYARRGLMVDHINPESLIQHKEGDLNITDFCDMDKFAEMMQNWAVATGLAVAAVDNHFHYLCNFYNFTDFCSKYNRTHPEKHQACLLSDHEGRGIYLCHAGLVDFAFPITLSDGTVLGRIYGGQVLMNQPDEEVYRKDARDHGFDEDDYIHALHQVNIRSKEQIECSAVLLTTVINTLVRSCYEEKINHESLNERTRIITSLSHIYFLNFYISLEDNTFFILDAPNDIRELAAQNKQADHLMQVLANTMTGSQDPAGMTSFNNLQTVAERLFSKQSISYEFISPLYQWCRASFIPVTIDTQGRITHVIYTLQQIQDEKENELLVQEELKIAAEKAIQANQAKTEFFSRMSHDIRTPMNGIIGMTHIAMDQPNCPRTTDCLKKIEHSSDYLLGLINDVLDMSRIESGEIILDPQPYPDTEFDEYMDSVLRPLAYAKRQTFITAKHVLQEYIPIMDKLRFNQILFNLLSNAIKYTPDGGRIDYDGITRIIGNKMELTIIVKDNGRGMSEEFQKVLFEPYTQEDRVRSMTIDNNGSGLGLAIVKKLVTLMNGTITVESKINVGSIFTVKLMLPYITLKEYQKRVKEAGTDNIFSLKGKRVLVCEDNAINQEIAVAILNRYGIESDLAANGMIGRSMFENSSPGQYYAILMDLRMPVMDGYDAAQSIRCLSRPDAATVPIIAMTADVFTEDIQHCLRAGMNDHIGKPLEPSMVYEKLKRYL